MLPVIGLPWCRNFCIISQHKQFLNLSLQKHILNISNINNFISVCGLWCVIVCGHVPYSIVDVEYIFYVSIAITHYKCVIWSHFINTFIIFQLCTYAQFTFYIKIPFRIKGRSSRARAAGVQQLPGSQLCDRMIAIDTGRFHWHTWPQLLTNVYINYITCTENVLYFMSTLCYIVVRNIIIPEWSWYKKYSIAYRVIWQGVSTMHLF